MVITLTKLYVGNLPYSVTDAELKDLFANYGNVASSSVIIDKHSGRSKGFGFIELEDDSMVEAAIADMNGKDFGGRNLVVSVARPMSDKPREFGSRPSSGPRRDFRGGDRPQRNRY